MKKLLPLLIACTFTLIGCSKLTLSNYDELKMGMGLEEVEAIIGGHDSCEDAVGTRTCVWGKEDGKHIKIRFVSNNAVTFSNAGLE